MPDALTFAVFALAVARATTFVTDDKLAERARIRFISHVKEGGLLEYMITCPWCVSIWIGAPAAFIWWNWPDRWWSLGIAAWWAFSQITGKLAQWGG